jgi:hypothetical protein
VPNISGKYCFPNKGTIQRAKQMLSSLFIIYSYRLNKLRVFLRRFDFLVSIYFSFSLTKDSH